jgi:hypothetical protein
VPWVIRRKGAATIFFLDAGAMNLSTKGAIITGE